MIIWSAVKVMIPSMAALMMITYMAAQEMTRLQGILAVASFTAGVTIACACLFVVPPPGEISNSAISIVSELLVLTGAILGVKTSFDVKFSRFQAELEQKADKAEGQNHENNRAEIDKNR